MPPVNTTIQCWVCEGFVLRSCLNWRLSVICWWRIVLWRVLMKDRIKYWREPKLQDLCITYKTESSTESAQINRALLRSSPRLAFSPQLRKAQELVQWRASDHDVNIYEFASKRKDQVLRLQCCSCSSHWHVLLYCNEFELHCCGSQKACMHLHAFHI